MKIINVIKKPGVYFKIALVKSRNLFRAYFYKGDAVLCQICGWKGTSFFNQKCPKCNSLPRTRLVSFTIDYFKLAVDKPLILHVAPNLNEYNYIRKHVAKESNYDRLNIRKVAHINIVQDLTQTNLKSDYYDLAIAWHVFEHIPEDKKAIYEVFRLLKPGGHFLISVPIYPMGNSTTYEDITIAYKNYEKIHGHYDHCRSCGLDYYQRFEDLGFTTEELKVDSLNTETIDYFGLRADHVVWCFTK